MRIWSLTNPEPFRDEVLRSSHNGIKNFGGGIEVMMGGTTKQVVGGKFRCWFHIADVGMFALYYAVKNDTIYISQYEWEVIKASGLRATKVEEGVLYVFSSKGLQKFKGDHFEYPEIQHPASFREASDGFWDKAVAAAANCMQVQGFKDVGVLVSGGTDGLLSAIALKEAGANVRAYTSGLSPDLFDPAYAATYCKELGIPHTFVHMPADEAGLHALLEKTLVNAELHDFSNVLMAMCCEAIGEQVRQDIGRDVVFHGYYADVLVGNEMLTYSKFNKNHPEGSPQRTDEAWRNTRAKDMRSVPNTMWIDKVSCRHGGDWNSLFFHPWVYHYMLSMPMEYAPVGNKKIIYYDVCDRYVSHGSWKDGKKAGFYTGSGMGKLRLDDGPLSDDKVHAMFNRLKPQIKK